MFIHTLPKDKIKMIVYCKDVKELHNYFNLSQIILGNQIFQVIKRREDAYIEGEEFEIRFVLLRDSVRGMKAHFVINLVQDEEMHYTRVLPATSIFENLLRHPKWKSFFN